LDKKTLPLVIVLVAAIIFFWPIMEQLGLSTPVDTPVSQESTPVDAPIRDSKLDGFAVSADKSLGESALRVDEAVSTRDSDELQPSGSADTIAVDTVTITTDKYTILLTSKGGGPISMLLNEHSYRDGELIQMLPEAVLVTPEVEFAGGTFSASRLYYQSSQAAGNYDVRHETFDISYRYFSPNGGEIVKSYRFYPDTYHFDLTVEVNQADLLGFEREYRLAWNTPLAPTEPQLTKDYDAMQAVAMMAGSRETLDDFDDNRLHQSLEGDAAWAGVRSKYFAAVLIPLSRQAAGVFAEGEKHSISTPDGSIEELRIMAGLQIEFDVVNSVADSFRVFVGPLDYPLMSEYEVGLEDVLGIGTMPVVGWLVKIFAVPIMWILPKMYSVVPNYGLVIILFALLVKIITLPLSMKSFRSMQAMKDLGPKIEELKKKHKKNPQALNQETMKMYKKHGVNPISGCLPMIPQMPLFIALFAVFRETILLRDAPFVWFITDLSRGASGFTDPYILLVVLMVVGQFASQKLTMGGSTQQNKMIGYLMPLFFGFLFYKFAAGLVLYWTCFSIFALLDYVLFKRKKNPEVKTA